MPSGSRTIVSLPSIGIASRKRSPGVKTEATSTTRTWLRPRRRRRVDRGVDGVDDRLAGRVAGGRHGQPVDLGGAALTVVVHHLAGPVGPDRRPFGAAAADVLAVGAGHRQPLVGADEDHHRLADGLRRPGSPRACPSRRRRCARCRSPGAGRGSRRRRRASAACPSSRSSGVESESPVTSSVPQPAAAAAARPVRPGSNHSGVTGEGPAAPPRPAPAAASSKPSADQLLVRREPAGEEVADFGEGQLRGDPGGRLADGEDEVAPDAGVQLLARAPHRAAGEDQQQEGDQRRRQDRVAGAEATQLLARRSGPSGCRRGWRAVGGWRQGHLRSGSR